MAPPSTSQLAVAPVPSSPRFQVKAVSAGPAQLPPATSASAKRWPAPVKLPPARPRVALLGAPPHLPIVNELLRKARGRNWSVLTDHLHSTALAHEGRLDGLLAFSAAAAEDVSGPRCPARPPCVTIALGDEFPSSGFGVMPDGFRIGEMAARHLAERDCATFLWAPFIDSLQSRERLRGFETQLRRLGSRCRSLPALHRLEDDGWRMEWATWRFALAASLGETRGRSAVFAANDCIAAHVAEACREEGKHVPEDVIILGVGDCAAECESCYVALSSIDLDLDAISDRALEMLADLMKGGAPEPRIATVAPKRVAPRSSSGEVLGHCARVAHAMAVINDRFPDPNFGVAQIAETINVSRRQLERDFRAANGCSIREYIEDARMSEAARLLRRHPRVTVAEIAALVGITSGGSFFRVFRRRYGTTPTEYRVRALAEAGAEPSPLD